MNTVETYAKNPDQLLDLIRDVITRLKAEDHQREIAAMEAQLREIARAVENLEKLSIPVPDALRAEKTRLAAAVGVQSDASMALSRLVEGVEEILGEFKHTPTRNTEPRTPRRTGRRRSTSPKTSRNILRELIIEALRQYGGAASLKDVHKFIEDKLKGKFLAGDLEWRESTKNYAWQNNTDWERYRMTQDGVLKKDSPTGTWELSEEYR